ncbi:MAG TPA: hypothetical protein DIC59_03750 [Candidatus Competibacteraceae bacterium]|nr:hypothetical protein [Candidatus Competibacteraceae bacterium]
MRSALESAGVGWSVWDYADFFGIATATGNTSSTADGAVIPGDSQNPARLLDAGSVAALVMDVPPPGLLRLVER